MYKIIKAKDEEKRVLDFKIIKMQIDYDKMKKRLKLQSRHQELVEEAEGPKGSHERQGSINIQLADDTKETVHFNDEQPQSRSRSLQNSRHSIISKGQLIQAWEEQASKMKKQIEYLSKFLYLCDNENYLSNQLKQAGSAEQSRLPDRSSRNMNNDNLDVLNFNVLLLIMIYLSDAAQTVTAQQRKASELRIQNIIIDFIMNDPTADIARKAEGIQE